MKTKTILMITAPFLLAGFVVCTGALFRVVSGRVGNTTFAQRLPSLETRTIRLSGKMLTIELATSADAQEQGLGDRNSMPKDHGMLFPFNDVAIHAFWMRHMRFPLDIIWLRDGEVVEIGKNLPAPTYVMDIPVTYTPKEKANSVLELNAGMADVYGLTKGLRVDSLKDL